MLKAHYDSERLEVRIMNPEEAEKVLNFYKENRAFLEPWEYEKEESFYDLAYHQQGLELEMKAFQHRVFYRYWLFLKSDRHFSLPIGSVSIAHIKRGAHQSCTLGYKLDHRYLKRGYMTEALKLMIEHLFTDMDMHRIEAEVMPSNLASIKVLEQLGFQQEGLAKSALKIKGKWEDHYRMALINPKHE